ncbi:glycosyltransferase [Sphingomonas paeninsulae]|nr:glycosyltransferase family 2 protein [Sphingomonas paeninsulae]
MRPAFVDHVEQPILPPLQKRLPNDALRATTYLYYRLGLIEILPCYQPFCVAPFKISQVNAEEDRLNEARSTERMIDVAVCTFRRASIEETLQSIASQQLPGDCRIRVIVADNDTAPTARATVEAAAARLSLNCLYVHAPAQNISIARNACLDHATAPFVAFIDDDEVATPLWLGALLAKLDETGADVILGPAIAQYWVDVPAWVRSADLHSTRPVIRQGGAIVTGYTCNVLMRLAAFEGRRFDPALGRTGGEDDVFFSSAVRDGVRIAYAPEAVVYDPVPQERANLRWLARRSFRNGQTYARTMIEGGGNRVLLFGATLAKVAACLGITIIMLPAAARWRRALIRGTLHAGACARYLGWREITLY